MVTLFQSITLEGWVDVMYQLQDGTSGTPMHTCMCAAQQAAQQQEAAPRAQPLTSKQHSRPSKQAHSSSTHLLTHLTTL